MSDIITETLLEMHFHRMIVDSFESVFGRSYLKLLKPSTVGEAWVGFDQGWVRTELTTNELFGELSRVIHNPSSSLRPSYLGYFMQFKVVEGMQRRSKYTPSGYTAPYFRAELSMTPNKTTSLSQHETLMRLSALNNAYVYYACPMFFELDDLYTAPDPNDLRLVDIGSAPRGWTASQRHFLVFQDPTDAQPHWMSEPAPASAPSFGHWIEDSQARPRLLTAVQLSRLIQDIGIMLSDDRPDADRASFPEAFTIVEFE